MATPFLIAETEDVAAIAADFGGDTVVVTFNELGTRRDGLQFWGDRLLEKLGLSSIGFVTTSPNWYPKASMEAIIPAVKKQIGDRRVITYGHSQGGYGALKFARALGVDVALAFCPQWSIDPRLVGEFDERFTQYHDPDKANGSPIEASDLSGLSFVFYDSRAKFDKLNVDRIKNFSGVTRIDIPFSDHDTIRLFSESRTAPELFEACRRRDGTALPRTIRRIARAARHGSPTYRRHRLIQLARRALLASDPLSCSTFFNQALNQDQPGYRFYKFISLRLAGLGADAQELKPLICLKDLEEVGILDLWTLATRNDLKEIETLIADLIFKEGHPNAYITLHAVNSLMKFGDTERAVEILEALSESSEIVEYLEFFTDYCVSASRTDLLDKVMKRGDAPASKRDIRLKIIEYSLHRSDRATAFKQLMSLYNENERDVDLLKTIADYLMRIGEITFARDIVQPAIVRRPEDFALRLRWILIKIHLNSECSLKEIMQLLREKSFEFKHFHEISLALESSGRAKDGLAVIEAAAGRPGNGSFAEARKAHLLIASAKIGSAKKVLQDVLRGPPLDPDQRGMFLELARRCDDQRLIAGFAAGPAAEPARSPGLIGLFSGAMGGG